MRKEYMIFFVLLGVAAMITGLTVGFVANYSYFQQGIEQNKAAALEKKTVQKVAVKDEVHKTEDKNSSSTDKSGKETGTSEANVVSGPSATAKANIVTGSTTVIQPMVDGTEITLPVSPDDMKSVNAMLDELNVADASSEQERIRNFQKQSGLEQTGVLDTYTLNAIIQQVAIKHAQANMYGG